MRIVIDFDKINKPYTIDDIKNVESWSELGRMINGWEVTKVEAQEEKEEETDDEEENE